MNIFTSTHSEFKTCFATKRIELTRKGLERFVSLTKNNLIVNLLRDIILVVVIYDQTVSEEILKSKKKRVVEHNGPISMSTTVTVPDDELKILQEDFEQLLQLDADLKQLRESQTDLELLKHGLCNIQTSHNGRLQSISLQAGTYQNTTEQLTTQSIRDWKRVWDEASYGYNLALTALVQSTLPVSKLDCFTNVYRCSIPCNTLSLEHIEPSVLQNTLQHLSSFHISMANRSVDREQFRDLPRSTARNNYDDDITIDPETWTILRTSDDNFTGMISLLQAMSSLEELYWHWYGTTIHGVSYNEIQHEIMFQRVINAAVLKSLKSCILAGLYVHEDDLLTLLDKAPELRRLDLRDIMLRGGTWRRFLDMCCSAEKQLDFIYLDDLWESSMIWFEGPGKPKMPRITPWGPSTLCRDGREEVRRPIVYHVATGRPLGSPQAYNWRQRRRLEYGPP